MKKFIFSFLAIVMIMVGACTLTASAAEENNTTEPTTTVSQSCTCEQTEPTTQSGCTCSDSSDDCCHVKDNNCCDCNRHHKQAVCSCNQNNPWHWEWNVFNIIGVILLCVGFLTALVGAACMNFADPLFLETAGFIAIIVGASMIVASLLLLWISCMFM